MKNIIAMIFTLFGLLLTIGVKQPVRVIETVPTVPEVTTAVVSTEATTTATTTVITTTSTVTTSTTTSETTTVSEPTSTEVCTQKEVYAQEIETTTQPITTTTTVSESITTEASTQVYTEQTSTVSELITTTSTQSTMVSTTSDISVTTTEVFTGIAAYRAPMETVFEWNDEVRDIGDYGETEELFLMDYAESSGVNPSDIWVYNTRDLTEELLTERDGKVLIERCVGLCCGKRDYYSDDDIYNGCILNADEPYNYIAFAESDCGGYICEGTVLLSYMVYDPSTSYVDDIMERYDFIICREYED